MSLRRRVALDVSHLPTHAFGSRDVMTWGTMGFMVIEGFTICLTIMVNVYLRKNFDAWPPEGIPRPSLVVPTIQVLVMLASLAVAHRIKQVSYAYDFEGVRRWLTAGCAVSAIIVGLRAWELTQSLNVRWDANAYGSAQWLVVGSHGSLLAIQLVEVIGMAGIFWLGPVEKKHFADAADVALYWYFIVLAWLPLYVLSFLLPYWT